VFNKINLIASVNEISSKAIEEKFSKISIKFDDTIHETIIDKAKLF
jgi:hypothetical protein